MKKSSKKAMLLIVLLLIVGITSWYVASTYAKYTSQLTRTGSVTVAKWAFATDNPSSTPITINITPTADASTLAGGKIAPGTSGSFNIALSNEHSDVGVDVTIAFTGTENVPSNLVFKQNGTAVNPTNGTITAKIAAGETLNVPLTWEWAYSTNATDDGEDTTDGTAGNTMTISAAITGTQVAPSATAITTGIQ